MNIPRFCVRAACAVPLIGAWLLAGCAVPLAPGYHIEREQIEVRYVSGPSPYLAIQCTYQLQNVGNSELPFVEAILPGEMLYGRQNLRVEVDGNEVPLLPSLLDSVEAPPRGIARIPFDPLWHMKQKRTLAIKYDLLTVPGEEARVSVNSASFYLPEVGWFPEFKAPKKLFAPDAERPAPTEWILRVPVEFRVHTDGEPVGTRRTAGEVEYRFRLAKRDPGPFAVAGAYQERIRKASNAEVVFWTFKALCPEEVKATGGRLGSTLETYSNTFGRLTQRLPEVWIIRTQEKLDASPIDSGLAWGVTLPDGLLLNEGAFDAGLQSEEFIEFAEESLARLWFGQRVAVRQEAEEVLGTGFARYATIVAAEAREGDAGRRKQILSLLDEYDRHRSHTIEKPLGTIALSDPAEQRHFARVKAPMFFIALEDVYGETVVRRGLARLAYFLGGQSAGISELRAALEAEAGKNLAEIFRAWLDKPGIPAEFRNHYTQESEQTGQEN